MNTIMLKIFFSGLITFVSADNGKTVTALLLSTPHVHQTEQASTVPEHRALLLAVGGDCRGNCTTRDVEVATFLYPDAASASDAVQLLATAVQRGGAWQLGGSEISLRVPASGVKLVHVTGLGKKAVPDTADERADFDWVPSLKAIDPSAGDLNPAVLSRVPPPELIAARFPLKSGTLSTFSVIEVDGKVIPIEFRPLGPTGRASWSRAVANWVEAEVQVPGDVVEVIEKSFTGRKKRTMRLAPRNGVVELVILNISRPVPPQGNRLPEPGAHFERFWLLSQHPPAKDERRIPQVPRTTTEQRDWAELHPHSRQRSSDLLDRILFSGGRGPYSQILCPMSQMP